MTDPVVGSAVFIWATGWAWFSVRAALKGSRQLVHPLVGVAWFFFALPVALDFAVRPPELSPFPRVHEAQQDPTAYYLYLLFVAYLFPALVWSGKGRDFVVGAAGPRSFPFPLMVLLFAVALSPLGLVVAAPDPWVYSKYAISQSPDFGGSVADWHALVAAASRASMLAVGAIMLGVRRFHVPLGVLMGGILIADVWVTGKRSAVAMAGVIVLYALWQRGTIRGRGILALGLVAVVGLLGYSSGYQETYRSDSTLGAGYDTFRVDFGRDAEMRTSIYSEISEGVSSVLPEGINTVILYAATYVPRDMWPGKPLPYAQYYTSAALNSEPKEWGWGLTTSFFGEWVSNFGLLGLLISPIAYGLVVRWASGSRSPLIRTLGMGAVLLLLIQHVTAFYIVFLAWIALRVGEMFFVVDPPPSGETANLPSAGPGGASRMNVSWEG